MNTTDPITEAAKVARLAEQSGMTDSVADDILRDGYERWLRLEEEKARVGDDLKELFAELKAQGFTPKALRESFRRVRNIDDADQQEHDAIVDLYVASLTRARPAPARAHRNIEQFRPVAHDPETGEIIEQNPTVTPTATTPVASVGTCEDGAGSDASPSYSKPETGDDDGNGGQRFGCADGEQHGQAPVQDSVGRGESADDGAQGQGPGTARPDRRLRAGAGIRPRQDEDRGSHHVGGEGSDQVTSSGDDAIGAVKGRARLPDAVGVETSSPDPIGAPPPPGAADKTGAASSSLVAPVAQSDDDVKPNPHCQKAKRGEMCGFAYSMASCWRCADAAMRAKEAA